MKDWKNGWWRGGGLREGERGRRGDALEFSVDRNFSVFCCLVCLSDDKTCIKYMGDLQLETH